MKCLVCDAEFDTKEDLEFHEKRCWDNENCGEINEANEIDNSAILAWLGEA